MNSRYFTIARYDIQKYEPNIFSSEYKIKVPLPSEFINAKVKFIKVLNFKYFNSNGQIDIGISLHSNCISSISPEADSMVCFTTYGQHIEKIFEIKDSQIKEFIFWFKDYKGKIITSCKEDTSFYIIELELLYQ